MATTAPEYDIVGIESQSGDGTQTPLRPWRKKLAAVTFVSVGLALLGWHQRGALRGTSSIRGMDAIELSRSQPIVAALVPTPPPVSLVTSMENSSEDAISWGSGFLAGSHDSIVNIYAVPSFQHVATLTDSRTTDNDVLNWVHSTAFGAGYFASCVENGDLIIYSVPAFKLLKRIDQGRACNTVTFGPGFVAAGGEGKVLSIYSLPSFQLMKNYSLGRNINGVAFNPGTLAVTTPVELRLYQVPGFQLMHTESLIGAGTVAFGPGVIGVEAWGDVHIYSLYPPRKLLKTISSEDANSSTIEGFGFGMGHVMISSFDGKVRIYSLPDYKLVQTIADAKEHTRVVAFQAPYMATCGWDDTLRLYTGLL